MKLVSLDLLTFTFHSVVSAPISISTKCIQECDKCPIPVFSGKCGTLQRGMLLNHTQVLKVRDSLSETHPEFLI